MKERVAILFDTISIQDYIFSSNKLKYNIGASYIVEYEVYNDTVIAEEAKKAGILFEKGYSGGGNLLLFFPGAEKNKVLDFVNAFSKRILVSYPGVMLGYGISDSFNEEDYKGSYSALLSSLQANKSSRLHISNILKQGITADCPITSKAAEWNKRDDNGKWISGEALSKLRYAKEATEILDRKYADTLKDKYAFPSELEDLGQPADSGYIGIVHADGNGIGKMFSEIKTLESAKALSEKIKIAAENAFISFLTLLIQKLDENPEMLQLKEDDARKKYMPIRPILMGGDDVTFVCEGKIALWCAEQYIACFTQQFEGVHMCAGIAIVKTKYPFFRAYHFSEALLKEAKASSRTAAGNYLSYYISASGNKDSLEDIRDNNSKYEGPYHLTVFGQLKKQIQYYSTKWNRNKLLQLRETLFKDKSSQQYFLEDIAIKNIALFPGSNLGNLKTEYDAIELTEFYPEQLF